MNKINPLKFFVMDDNGDDVELPSKAVVCHRCNGSGVHDHPAFSNGISQSEFDEDEDFRESYFAGNYDVPCSECGGLRVVASVDEEKLTADQRRLLQAHWEARCEEAAERRMRSAGIEF